MFQLDNFINKLFGISYLYELRKVDGLENLYGQSYLIVKIVRANLP